MDMSRDIYKRLHITFMADCEFQRIALNMDQIEEYQPPPNPAKTTDSRYKAYIAQFGNESWELDALEPRKFRELIQATLDPLKKQSQWDKDLKEKQRVKTKLKKVADEWNKPKPNGRNSK